MSYRIILEAIEGAPEEIVWRALEYIGLARDPPTFSEQFRAGRQGSGNHWGITRSQHAVHLFMDTALQRFLRAAGVIVI